MMKRNSMLSATVVALIAAMFVTPVLGQPTPTPTPYSAHLTGYEETPLTLNTTGSGDFKAVVSADGTSIQYMLSYQNLSTPALQSHIHFGRPAIGGGVVLFLCTNLGNAPATVPTPQPCPPFPATIFGTLTAADVVAVSGQGIDPGAAGFAEMVAALRTGSAYANVHTTLHPGGEIRARLGPFPATATTDTSND